MKPRLFLDSFRGSFRGSLRESLESLALLCPTALYGPPPRVQLLPWNLGPGRIFLRRTARALPSGRVFPLCAHAAPTLSSGPAPRGVGPCRKASRGAALQPSMMDLSLSWGMALRDPTLPRRTTGLVAPSRHRCGTWARKRQRGEGQAQLSETATFPDMLPGCWHS